MGLGRHVPDIRQAFSNAFHGCERVGNAAGVLDTAVPVHEATRGLEIKRRWCECTRAKSATQREIQTCQTDGMIFPTPGRSFVNTLFFPGEFFRLSLPVFEFTFSKPLEP